MYNNQRISKKKTHVKKRTLNPVFNESFVFDLPRNESGLGKVEIIVKLIFQVVLKSQEWARFKIFIQGPVRVHAVGLG